MILSCEMNRYLLYVVCFLLLSVLRAMKVRVAHKTVENREYGVHQVNPWLPFLEYECSFVYHFRYPF